jgi:hypothetical protein
VLITDTIVAAAIKAAGQVIAAGKREGAGHNKFSAAEDGRLIGDMANAIISKVRDA